MQGAATVIAKTRCNAAAAAHGRGGHRQRRVNSPCAADSTVSLISLYATCRAVGVADDASGYEPLGHLKASARLPG
jgi:hypothetical protein